MLNVLHMVSHTQNIAIFMDKQKFIYVRQYMIFCKLHLEWGGCCSWGRRLQHPHVPQLAFHPKPTSTATLQQFENSNMGCPLVHDASDSWDTTPAVFREVGAIWNDQAVRVNFDLTFVDLDTVADPSFSRFGSDSEEESDYQAFPTLLGITSDRCVWRPYFRPSRNSKGVSFGNYSLETDTSTELGLRTNQSFSDLDSWITGSDQLLVVGVDEHPAALLILGYILSGAQCFRSDFYQMLEVSSNSQPSYLPGFSWNATHPPMFCCWS